MHLNILIYVPHLQDPHSTPHESNLQGWINHLRESARWEDPITWILVVLLLNFYSKFTSANLQCIVHMLHSDCEKNKLEYLTCQLLAVEPADFQAGKKHIALANWVRLCTGLVVELGEYSSSRRTPCWTQQYSGNRASRHSTVKCS